MRKKKTEKKPRKEMRAVPLTIGSLSVQKWETLTLFRAQCLTHAQAVAQLLFQPDPLTQSRTAKETYALLSTYQKRQVGFNKVYLQVVAQQVQAAAFEQEKRFFCRFWGRLRHVASEIPTREGKTRKFYYVPENIQNAITPAELNKLAALPDTLESADLRAQLAAVIRQQPTSFTAHEQAVIREIHAQVLRRHRPLTFKDDDFTSVSIPLDYRMLPVSERDLPKQLSPEVRLLADSKNKQYKFFLSLASPIPRGERLKLPVTIKREVVQKLMRSKASDVNSLTLVLSKNRASVRLVIAQPKASTADKSTHFVARDFGYVNTISLSVIAADRAVDEQTVKNIQAFTKEEARKYFETHAHPNGQALVIERKRFSGRRFLDAINRHCEQIDQLRSWIDNAYNQLDLLKQEIAASLKLPPDALLPNDGSHPKLKKFFQLLAKIQRWKDKRRALYQKTAALKKCWFGFLANRELELATKHNATVVREKLTNVAIPVADPKYKGRLFNKMLNNGARGQYERIASNKFSWYGVPEIALPSFYTSQTCTTHASVEEQQRQGEVFTCRVGGEVHHADEHAADTIGLYLLLQPIHSMTPTFPPSAGSPVF